MRNASVNRLGLLDDAKALVEDLERLISITAILESNSARLKW